MSKRARGRIVGALALSAVIVTGSGVGALAHECINASRSDTGNEMAGSRSQAWVTVRIADFIADDVANDVYSAEDGECLLAAYTESGAPLSFTVHVKGATGQEGVIGLHNMHEELYVNGKGIDHFFDAYGWAIFGAFDTCGVSFPM